MSDSIRKGAVLAWALDNRLSFVVEYLKIENTLDDGGDPANDLPISVADVAGLVIKKNGNGNAEAVLDGDEANLTGIVLGAPDGVSAALELDGAAVTTAKYPVLFRGPAQVVKEKIQTTDVAEDTLDIDDIETALLALDIQFVTEPTETTTQST